MYKHNNKNINVLCTFLCGGVLRREELNEINPAHNEDLNGVVVTTKKKTKLVFRDKKFSNLSKTNSKCFFYLFFYLKTA